MLEAHVIKNDPEKLLPSPDTPSGDEETVGRTVLEIEFRVGDLRETLPGLNGGEAPFDLVFHDPFSPPHVPELWTVELFREYHRLLKARGGRLLTYSAAAAVRGGLLEAGFILGKTVGVGDKTGGTAAWIPSMASAAHAGETGLSAGEEIRPLDAWEQAYLNSRAGLPYRDPDLDDNREEIEIRRAEEQVNSSRPSGTDLRKQKPDR
jgi:tRNA U34 5-methylaminomethyl-2-thiouridine-forming methyltransferase MnmC